MRVLLTLLLIAPSLWASSSTLVDHNGQATGTIEDGIYTHRIPDYSHAGYRGGGVDFPAGTVRATLTNGATSAQIATALATAAGFGTLSDPGVVLLEEGTYTLSGSQQILLNASHVILRGVGNGTNPASNTIINRTGTSTTTPIIVGGTGTAGFAATTGSSTNITDDIVQVGSRSFTVASASGFSVGSVVIINHPCTAEWIAAVDGGGVQSDPEWAVNSRPIRYHRIITAIDGNVVTVDAPILNHLNKSLSQSTMTLFDNSGRLTNIGIENLRLTISTASETAETHALNAIEFQHGDNFWAKDVVVEHFRLGGIRFSQGVTRSTVVDCQALDPHGSLSANRYNFMTEGSQLILFEACIASNARHGFVTNGQSTDSGIVFLDSQSTNATANCHPHRGWSHGILYDNTYAHNSAGISTGTFTLCNSGDQGTSHGWQTAHSVLWNCEGVPATTAIILQKPPTGQNYAIGVKANIVASSSAYNFGLGNPAGGAEACVLGFVESQNTYVTSPASLYRAQLAFRLNESEGPEWTADYATVDFGYRIENTNTDIVVTLTNVSGGTLSATVTEDSAHYSIQSGGTITDLAADGTHEVTVRYAPTTAAQHTATLSISGDSFFALPLTGVAVSLQSGLSFAADAGTIVAPFVDGGDYISQATNTATPTAGGIAAYGVSIATAGTYKIATTVEAPSTSANSFFVGFATEPGNDKIWDVQTLTTGTPIQKDVSARGPLGDFDAPQFDPALYNLAAGNHILIVRGREANTRLYDLELVLVSEPTPAPSPTTSGTISGRGFIAFGASGRSVLVNPVPAPPDLPPEQADVLINCGGGAVQIGEEEWEADQYFNGGGIHTVATSISGTTREVLFRSERNSVGIGGPLVYSIPLANGNWDVELGFAEIFYSSTGQRVMDLAIEGVDVDWGPGTPSETLDIVEKVGANAAYVQVFPTTVEDNFLTLSFTSTVDLPKVSYIKLTQTTTTAPSAPTLTITPGDGQNTITFAVPPGATSVDVWESTSSPVSTAGAATFDDTFSGVVSTGLDNGTEYFYVAKATNAAGTSAAGDEASGTPVAAGEGATYVLYVETTGNDANDGSNNTTQALATLTGARNRLRVLTGRTGDTSTITGDWDGALVIFGPGYYHFTAPVVFNKQDSGTEAGPIVYQGSAGTVFSGAVDVPDASWLKVVDSGAGAGEVNDSTAWNRLPANARGNVYRLNTNGLVNRGLFETTSGGVAEAHQADIVRLIDNGAMRTLARWPDGPDNEAASWIRATSWQEGSPDYLRIPSTVPAAWGGGLSGQDGRIYGMTRTPYYVYWSTISALSQVGSTTQINTSIFNTGQTPWPFLAIRNLLQTLDREGEWVWNWTNQFIYYWPVSGGVPTDVHLNSASRLITMGVPGNASHATNWVTFKGLTMEGTRETALRSDHGTGLVIDGCEIRNVSGLRGAVRAQYQTKTGIKNSNIHTTAVGAILLHGGDHALLNDAENYITDTEIHNIGVEICAEILTAIETRPTTTAHLTDSSGLTISRVHAHNIRDGAITLNAARLVIEESTFDSALTIVGDAGALTAGFVFTNRYGIIRKNIFRNNRRIGDVAGDTNDLQHPFFGALNTIYMDLLAGWLIEDNLFENCEHPIFVAGGKDHIIRRNKFVNSHVGRYQAPVIWGHRAGSPHTLPSVPEAVLTQDLAAVSLGSAPWSTDFPLLIQYRIGGAREAVRMYHENITFVDNLAVGGSFISNFKPNTPTTAYPNTVGGFAVGVDWDQLNYPMNATPTATVNIGHLGTPTLMPAAAGAGRVSLQSISTGVP